MSAAALDTLAAAESPEGIELAQRAAGPTARVLAYAIDLLIRIVVLIVSGLVARSLGGMGSAAVLILIFALEWLYPVVFELSPWGATPGKRALKLRVVMDSGLPVTPAAALTRNLLRTVDFLPAGYGFGLACVLLRADFKRLGDLAAGTLVVHTEEVMLHGDVAAVAPVAPARPLGLDEQAAIVAWAGRSRRLTPQRAEELARIAAPVLPAQREGEPASAALLGVACWLLGRREGEGA